jgi:hypothetical protein
MLWTGLICPAGPGRLGPAGVRPGRRVAARARRAGCSTARHEVGHDSTPQSCVTVDLHAIDLPEDIAFASEWLAGEGVAATFFVPSSLLLESRFATVLRALPELGHEVASHSHRHDWEEADALVTGRDLGFLSASRALHEDFFQSAPLSFRSPHWSVLAPATIAELARLGYQVDSSATPQRLPLLSSRPFAAGWLFTPRRPHPLVPGLLEIATSTLLVPAGGSTFLILRRATRVYLGLLEAEARWTRGRVLVVQLHVEDLNLDSRRVRGFGPLTLGDFMLRRRGGVGLKWSLQERDPRRITTVHHDLVRHLASLRCGRLADVARTWRPPEWQPGA